MTNADIMLCRMWASVQKQHVMFVLEGERSPDLGAFTGGAAQRGTDGGVARCLEGKSSSRRKASSSSAAWPRPRSGSRKCGVFAGTAAAQGIREEEL